ADAFAVQGGTANITALGATAVGNNGVLLSASQNAGAPAVVTMTAAASQLTGAILTDAASTSNVTLAGGTTWKMTGNSNVTNLTNNDSLIRFTSGARLSHTGGDSAGIARGDWARFYGQQIDNRYQAFADPRARGWLRGDPRGVAPLRRT